MGILGSKTKFYSLARVTKDEQMINDYNSALLLMEINVNIQYILSDITDVNNYVASCTIKHKSSKVKKLLKKSINVNLDRKYMFHVMINLLKNVK